MNLATMANVRNTDEGIPPTEEDMLDIEKNVCLNCGEWWNGTILIFFVRLGNRNLLWWHSHHCNKKTK